LAHDSSQKIIGRARHVGEALRDQTPGTGFGCRNGSPLFGQEPAGHGFERFFIFTVDEVADALANRLHHLIDLRVGLGDRNSARHYAQKVVGKAGSKGEFRTAVLGDIRKLAFQGRLPHAKGTKQPGPDPGYRSTSLEPIGDSGQNLLVQHPGKLARNTRHADDDSPLLFDQKPGRGSHRVRQNLGTGGEVGLFSVGLVHFSAYAIEEGADGFERCLVELQFTPESLGENLGGEIIPGWPEPARNQ